MKDNAKSEKFKKNLIKLFYQRMNVNEDGYGETSFSLAFPRVKP